MVFNQLITNKLTNMEQKNKTKAIDEFIRDNFWMEHVLNTFAQEVFENNDEKDVGQNEEIFIQRFKKVLLENYVECPFNEEEEDEEEEED